MHRTAVCSNSNIKIVHNSIEHFLWNPSDFSPDNVLSCLWIVFTNSVFHLPPSENSHVSWDLRNRMARGYWFDTKWVSPMGSCTWGIQVYYSRNEATPHFSNRTLEYLTRNFLWDRLILRQTDNPWSSYSQDLKTIHRQERISSEEKSDGFHKKCSMELWTILMFELLLCCHTAVRWMERT